MAALGRELGRTVGRAFRHAPLERRVRIGAGGAISALGLVTLAAQAVRVVAP